MSETAAKRIDCLDCKLLNPARRKRDKTAEFAATLYHQNNHTLHDQKEPLTGIIVAERARTEKVTIMSIHPADRSQHRQKVACILRALLPVPPLPLR